MHALVVKQMLITGEEQNSVEHPTKVKTILDEFRRIMLEDLTEGLPLMRDIKQQINLISSVSLPNLPHYKMNPKENEILKEKVEEIVTEGTYLGDNEPMYGSSIVDPKEG